MIRGCFGHSWDLWPVSLAKYAAAMREGERRFLSAEALLAVAGGAKPGSAERMSSERQRAEWCWAMLSDHAWNGTDEQNKRLNASLRRRWGEELLARADEIERAGWACVARPSDTPAIVVFNSLSIQRRDLVRIVGIDAAKIGGVRVGGELLPVQRCTEGDGIAVCFVAPPVPGFGFRDVELVERAAPVKTLPSLKAVETLLESPFYRLVPDARTGGIASLVHVASGKELVSANQNCTIGQTVYFDGEEHLLNEVRIEPLAAGPLFAQLRISGETSCLTVENLVTVYAELDRVDFDVRITKQPSGKLERLCQVFPLLSRDAMLRAASSGAVVRLRPQPTGDLLPGADTKRYAVQEFVNVTRDDLSVTLVPHDAFTLRLDLDSLAFEALGNDQNHREVLHDQDGQTQFRFRYSLQAADGGYRGSDAIAFARSTATPLICTAGRLAVANTELPRIDIDAARAVATCLKPADDPQSGGIVLRIWETAGRDGPLKVGIQQLSQVFAADLLERDQNPLAIRQGVVELNLKPHGYAALRLSP